MNVAVVGLGKIGVPLAVLAASYRDRWPDRVIRGSLVATSYQRVPGGRPLTAADRPHFTVHVAQDTGKFYEKCAERAPSKVATPELAAELWKRSEEWAAAS